MFCQSCSVENEDNSYKCVSCGAVLQQVAGAVGEVQASPQVIPNYLAQSILVTLLCCLPLGIPAIVFAAGVNGKLQAGDVEGAMKSSKTAKMWCWIALGVGLVYITFQIVIQVIAIVASEM